MNSPAKIVDSFHGPESSIDLPMLRHELECAATLNLQDLTHEMQCQSEELPALHFWMAGYLPSPWQIARLMATCFEAGRRYGLLSAIAYCSPDIITPDPPTAHAIRQRYANVSTIDQAEQLSAFDAIYDKTMEILGNFEPRNLQPATDAGRRLDRLQAEQPELYTALISATRRQARALHERRFPDVPTNPTDSARGPHGTCQREDEEGTIQ